MKIFRALLVIPLTMLFSAVLAQQDPEFSQYMFSNMSINPGYAGSKDAICATAIFRQQWVGFAGAPTTGLFTANAPVHPFNINSGVGVSIISDVIGVQKDIGGNLSYAYIMNIKNGESKLGIGLSGGFLNRMLDGSKFEYGVNNPPQDNSIPQNKETKTTLDMGLGMFYRSEALYFGLSSTHILASKLKYTTGNDNLVRHFYVTSGYSFALSNPAFEMQPSVLIGTDLSSTRIDLNTLLLYNKRIWGGVSYRVSSALVGIIGIELSNGVKIGYSYDFSMNAKSNSTHEIMINYCFNILKEKIPHKYRSVRFL